MIYLLSRLNTSCFHKKKPYVMHVLDYTLRVYSMSIFQCCRIGGGGRGGEETLLYLVTANVFFEENNKKKNGKIMTTFLFCFL
jgi:hypothetical protein